MIRTVSNDIKEEVRKRIRLEDVVRERVKLERADDNWKGKCPFHIENNPSFFVYPDGRYHCFGCKADGDVFDFVMKTESVAFPEALKRVADRAGVPIPPSVSSVTPLHDTLGLTLEELADVKKLPIDFLKSLGVCNKKWNTIPAVYIPYPKPNSQIGAVRYRIGLDKSDDRFRWRKNDKVMLYGLNRLAGIRKLGRVLLVEGESDCWTAWYYNLPALGMPGKGTWQSEWAIYFEGLEVYLWVEPDADDLIMRVAKDIPTLRVIRAPEGIPA